MMGCQWERMTYEWVGQKVDAIDREDGSGSADMCDVDAALES